MSNKIMTFEEAQNYEPMSEIEGFHSAFDNPRDALMLQKALRNSICLFTTQELPNDDPNLQIVLYLLKRCEMQYLKSQKAVGLPEIGSKYELLDKFFNTHRNEKITNNLLPDLSSDEEDEPIIIDKLKKSKIKPNEFMVSDYFGKLIISYRDVSLLS